MRRDDTMRPNEKDEIPQRRRGLCSRLSFGLWIGLLLLVIATVARSQSRSISEPEPQSNCVLRFTAQGEFRSTKGAAQESALQSAQEEMRAWLAKQQPPIRRVPSLESIRRENMIKGERTEVETVLNEKMYKITAIIDLKPDQVRELRKHDRSLSTLWLFGGLIALLGVVSAGFRVDEWTKGYLTKWLIAGGLALGVFAVVVLWWMK